VMLKYKMANGRAALIRAPQASGLALPFGADVVDVNGVSVGVVAQNSQIFARGLETKGTLYVKWGGSIAEQCKIEYALPDQATTSRAAYTSFASTCE